jgi:hypothetical protein
MRPIPLDDVEYKRAEGFELTQAAKTLEFEIFSQSGYPGKRGCLEEYEGYPSIFYVAVYQGSEVVGVVRKILPSALGFTTTHLNLTPEWEEKIKTITATERCEEIATTALRKGFRGRNNFSCVLNLFKMAYEDAVSSGVRYWLAPIEPPVLMHYVTTFHFNFVAMGEAQDYLGAPTIPCVIELCSGIQHLHSCDSELGQFFTEGLSPPQP